MVWHIAQAGHEDHTIKKPNKENYTIAKAWPISLLATLGKVLESVIAERISHAVETYGLLPTSHFGAQAAVRAEQALLLLQEAPTRRGVADGS